MWEAIHFSEVMPPVHELTGTANRGLFVVTVKKSSPDVSLGVVLRSEAVAGEKGDTRILQLTTDSMLRKAGALPGDVVLDVDGKPSEGAEFVSKALRSGYGEVELLLRRPRKDDTSSSADCSHPPLTWSIDLLKGQPAEPFATHITLAESDSLAIAEIRGGASWLDVAVGDRVLNVNYVCVKRAQQVEEAWLRAPVGPVHLLVEAGAERVSEPASAAAYKSPTVESTVSSTRGGSQPDAEPEPFLAKPEP